MTDLRVCKHCRRVSCVASIFRCDDWDGALQVWSVSELLDWGYEHEGFLRRAESGEFDKYGVQVSGTTGR